MSVQSLHYLLGDNKQTLSIYCKLQTHLPVYMYVCVWSMSVWQLKPTRSSFLFVLLCYLPPASCFPSRLHLS